MRGAVAVGRGAPGEEEHERAEHADPQQGPEGDVPAGLFHQQAEAPTGDDGAGVTEESGEAGGGRGGAIAPNIGWFNNINQWNSGQARVPYIGKNGRVNFAGFSFGRNGISGPAFNATKFGGNFFGIPIRFKY